MRGNNERQQASEGAKETRGGVGEDESVRGGTGMHDGWSRGEGGPRRGRRVALGRRRSATKCGHEIQKEVLIGGKGNGKHSREIRRTLRV